MIVLKENNILITSVPLQKMVFLDPVEIVADKLPRQEGQSPAHMPIVPDLPQSPREESFDFNDSPSPVLIDMLQKGSPNTTFGKPLGITFNLERIKAHARSSTKRSNPISFQKGYSYLTAGLHYLYEQLFSSRLIVEYLGCALDTIPIRWHSLHSMRAFKASLIPISRDLPVSFLWQALKHHQLGLV